MVVHWWSPRTLASVSLAVLFLPLASAAPEVRDPSEATVFVDGDSDYIEFYEGSGVNPAAWTVTAPDGATAVIVREDPLPSGGTQRWTLGGTHLAGGPSWSWASGTLDGAAADGTWTLTTPGFYSSGSNGPALLVVQGRAIQFSAHGYTGMGTAQTWNWHMGSWTENHAWSATDLPNESPQEDPQFARFFTAAPTLGPVGQSIPGHSDSETVPGQDIDTPPFTVPATCTLNQCDDETSLGSTPPATIPATCTLDPCDAETPIVTPAQPVPETCVPPLVPVLCVGPFTLPPQDLGDAPAVCDTVGVVCVGPIPIASEDLGDAPAICDAASQVCVGPFPVPAQDVVGTAPITVAVDFTGLDAFADPNAGEIGSIGPIVQVIPVPLVGDVPVTLCPGTCPFPVSPEGETVGNVTITVTAGDEEEIFTVPLGTTL